MLIRFGGPGRPARAPSEASVKLLSFLAPQQLSASEEVYQHSEFGLLIARDQSGHCLCERREIPGKNFFCVLRQDDDSAAAIRRIPPPLDKSCVLETVDHCGGRPGRESCVGGKL